MKTPIQPQIIISVILLASLMNPHIRAGEVQMIASGQTPTQTHEKLQRAVDASDPGDVIVLRAGVYEIDGPLRVPHALSLHAENGEDVVVSGGRRLSLEWVDHTRGVMRADLPVGLDLDCFAFDGLYLNGTRLHMARYPDYDPDARFFGGTAEDALSPERVARWKDPEGGFIHSLHRAKWAGNHWRITGMDADGALAHEGGWMNNRPSGINPKERFVENIFEELDAPGEWFVDRNNRVLYLYPPAGVELDSAEVVASGIERLIEVVGESPATPAGGLSLRGIKFAHTARTFMKTNEPLLRSDWMIHRGGAVYVENAEDVVIQDCVFCGLGGNGVFVSGYARGVEVRGCHFTGLGASSVCFVGKPEAVRSPSFRYGEFVEFEDLDRESGPKTQDYPRDCLVEDSLMHDLGAVEKQVAGVQISMASRITVRHVSIYDVPRAGINISEGTWGGHLIESCDVFDTVQMTGDHGSFNSWGRDRFWHPNRGRMDEITREEPGLILLDAVEKTVVRSSRWRCDHGWDIDLDDGSSNYEIYNNLCLNGGVKLREGFHRTVYNNIMVNNSFHPHVWFSPSHDVFERNIVTRWYRPIRVSDWGDRINHNLLPDAAALEESHTLGLDPDSAAGDPMFIDPASGDFRVAEGSPAFTVGFKNFPMDQFGVQKPSLKAIARTPDIPKLTVEHPPPLRDHLVRTFLGASVKKLVGNSERSATGIDADRGLLVVKTPEDSLAFRHGLRENDVILKIDDTPVNRVDEVQPTYLKAASERVTLMLFRDQIEQSLELDTGLVVRLTAEDAKFVGDGRNPRYNQEEDFIGAWTDPAASLRWTIPTQRPGKYDVMIELAAAESISGCEWTLTVGEETLGGQTPDTGGNQRFERVHVGAIGLGGTQGGVSTELNPQDMPNMAVMNLRAIELVRKRSETK